MNGMIEFDVDTTAPFDFGTTATYSCNDGFFLEGNTVRNCEGDGSRRTGLWDGTAPVCTGMCTHLMHVRMAPNLSTYIRRFISKLVCIPQSLILHCLFVAITCINLNAPTNGIITFSAGTTAPYDYQTTATYSCNTGYGLSGKDSVRTCLGSTTGVGGEWSATAPTCEGTYVYVFI